MFDRRLFLQLNQAYGPFTLDACCDVQGSNAQVPNICCKKPNRSFLDTRVAGHNVWLNPPFDTASTFVKHYLAEKAKDPTHTSAMLVLPFWPYASWWKLLSGMQHVVTYAAGSYLFTAPGPLSNGARRNVGPTRWPVVILWDAPALEAPGIKPSPWQELITPAPAEPAVHATAPTADAACAAADASPAVDEPTTSPLHVFIGKIQGRTVRILFDSGASCNAVAADMVADRKFVTKPMTSQAVTGAFGSPEHANSYIPVKLQLGTF